MIQIGNINTLKCIEKTDKGMLLDGEDLGELLVPNSQLPDNLAVNDTIPVFVYHDTQERPTATTIEPKVQVGQFASLHVKQVNKAGAFMDWGLPKDLLVPYNQQKVNLEEGKRHIVRVYLDARTNRIAASARIDKYLNIWPADYEDGQEVKLLIAGKTDLGFKAIVNDSHWGLLYENEVFKRIHTGQQMVGFVKKVREDGHVDLTLNKSGRAKINDFADDLLAYLEKNNGFCPINDKSSPELINRTFGVSKKTYKSTVGRLLKLGK